MRVKDDYKLRKTPGCYFFCLQERKLHSVLNVRIHQCVWWISSSFTPCILVKKIRMCPSRYVSRQPLRRFGIGAGCIGDVAVLECKTFRFF